MIFKGAPQPTLLAADRRYSARLCVRRCTLYCASTAVRARARSSCSIRSGRPGCGASIVLIAVDPSRRAIYCFQTFARQSGVVTRFFGRADVNVLAAPLNLQVAILLNAHLLKGLKLALEPRKLGGVVTVTLHQEGGWPE
jgi:hypothetical protein